MNRALVLMFLLINGLGFAQLNEPLYQQIAFDFYRTEIIDSISVKKQINIYKYALNFKTNLSSFYIPSSSCMSNKVWKNKDLKQRRKQYIESLIYINPNRFKLDFSDLDETLFKIKRYRKGNYPKLFIGSPYKEYENDNRVLINIYLERNSDQQDHIYHLVIDQTGKIKDWCKKGTNRFKTNMYFKNPYQDSLD